VGVSAAFYSQYNLWTNTVAPDLANGIPGYPSLQTIFSGTVDVGSPSARTALAQQYEANTIGTFPADEINFYDKTMPYAIMAAHDNPQQLPPTPPASPYPSYYSGAMPFLAGVYWHQATVDGCDSDRWKRRDLPD
jgi:hypothetical protein